MNTIKINKKNTLMVAHRGLSGIEKENTLAAFVAAGNRSYYGFECDIHKTIDGKYVVIHDSNTERVAGEAKVIEESTFDEIRQLQLLDSQGVNQKQYFIPTLAEYIEVSKRYEKECVIEIKGVFSEADVLEVIDIIKDLDYLDHCIFISFGIENIKYVRKHLKDIPCQLLLVEFSEEAFAECLKYQFGLDIYFPHLTQEIIDRYHEYNLLVNAWTVNQKEDGERLAEMGIDFITTNILE